MKQRRVVGEVITEICPKTTTSPDRYWVNLKSFYLRANSGLTPKIKSTIQPSRKTSHIEIKIGTRTGGFRQFDYLVRALQRAGPRKLPFGSDCAWLHPGVEIQEIRLLGLPLHKEALVLAGSALRLLAGSATLNAKAPARATHIKSCE